jgi:hypothetical protein
MGEYKNWKLDKTLAFGYTAAGHLRRAAARPGSTVHCQRGPPRAAADSKSTVFDLKSSAQKLVGFGLRTKP